MTKQIDENNNFLKPYIIITKILKKTNFAATF